MYIVYFLFYTLYLLAGVPSVVQVYIIIQTQSLSPFTRAWNYFTILADVSSVARKISNICLHPGTNGQWIPAKIYMLLHYFALYILLHIFYFIYFTSSILLHIFYFIHFTSYILLHIFYFLCFTSYILFHIYYFIYFTLQILLYIFYFIYFTFIYFNSYILLHIIYFIF